MDEAILECKVLNAKPKQITKLVSYKCKDCCKYHIGRNGKTLTQKYKDKLNVELGKIYPQRVKKANKMASKLADKLRSAEQKENGNATDNRFGDAVFTVVGKIDLSKVPKK